MTYADALPYLHTGIVYAIGWWFGRRRGKANAAAETERLRKLAKEALALAQRQSASSVIR